MFNFKNNSYGKTNSVQFMGDMDGNGLPDFMASENKLRGIQGDIKADQPLPDTIYLTKRSTFGSLSFNPWVIRGLMASGSFTNYIFHYFMDINGDGLQDWMAWKEISGELRVRINQGAEQFSDWRTINNGNFLLTQVFYKQLEVDSIPIPIEYPRYLASIRQHDMDADGRAELLFPDNIPVIESCRRILFAGSGTPLLCGEELYTEVQDANSGAIEETAYGNRWDESIYKYKAVKFHQQLDGSFTAEVTTTELLGSATQTASIDAFGNGLSDFVFAYGCRSSLLTGLSGDCTFSGSYGSLSSSSFGVYINRNRGSAASGDTYQPTDMLTAVENGLDYRDEWEYRPLTSRDDEFHSSNLPFYERDDAYLAGLSAEAQQAHLHFASSMYVVAEHRYSNGVDSTLNKRQYRYKGAMMNREGRGFQGFRTVIVEDINAGLMNRSEFHQVFPLAGQLHRTYQWTLAEVGSDTMTSLPSPISENRFSWNFWPSIVNGGRTGSYAFTVDSPQDSWTVPTPASSYFIGPETQTNISRDLAIGRTQLNRTDTLSSFDDWGNQTHSTTTVNNGFSTVEAVAVSTYIAADENNWWINKLNTSTVTSQTLSGYAPYLSSLDPDKQISTQYTWTSYRQPNIITVTPVFPLGAKASAVDTDYNVYGLPTKVKTYEPGQPYRQITTNYSNNGDSVASNGYFPYQITNDLSQTVVTKTYPTYGRMKNITANNQTTTTEYDAFGRVEKVIPPSSTGQPAYSRFAVCSNCDGISNSNIAYKVTTYSAGTPTSVLYKDKLNRVLVAKTEGFDGSPIYLTTTYDILGRKLYESIPSFNLTESKGTHFISYDLLNRLTEKEVDQATAAPLATMNLLYSYNAHTTDITVNNYLNLSRTYSGNGQLINTVDAIGGITRYAYDAMGNPIVLEDANGNPIQAEYNALGQKNYVDDPNMGHKSFSYTSFGEVASETDANGDTTSYLYDDLGRLTTRKVNNATEASFYYDSAQCEGVPTSENRSGLPSGNSYSRSYSYDGYCRPETVTTTIDGTAYTMKTQYDSNYGRVKAVVYPSGLTVKTLYNARGYASTSENAGSGYQYQEIIQMNARGQLTEARKAQGNITEGILYAEETGQMEEITASYNNSNLLRHFIHYEYDEYGNLDNQQVKTLRNNVATDSIETFGYDNLHRLTSSTRTIGNLTQTPMSYSYDAVGNFTSKSDYATGYSYGTLSRNNGNAGPNAVRSITKASGYGANATYDYDLNGNLESGDGKMLTYNAFNKPLTITKGAITSNFYYGSNQLRYKQKKVGQASGDEITIYIDKAYEIISYDGEVKTRSYLGDAIITKTENNGDDDYSIGFVHRDRLGSVVTILDENGNIMDNRSYDPFGKPRTGLLENVDPLAPATLREIATHIPADGFSQYTSRGFTDHEHLDDAELIHMNGRVYDYNLGRFLSVDPFIQSPGNSQSMNPYSYIMNNPLSGTDPSGYMEEGETEVKVKVAAVTGSRLGRTETVTVKIDSNADGNATTVTLTGGSKSAQAAVKSSVKNTEGQLAKKQQSASASPAPAGNGGNNQGTPAARANVEMPSSPSGVSNLHNSDDKNGVFTNAEDIINRNPDLHGEVTEFLDGRVQVAKWGSKDAVISEDELSAIRLSLDNLDNSDGGKTDSGYQLIGGKQLLDRLSKKNPLKILLNTSGVNSSQENAVRLIAIDIGSDVYFKNYNNGRKWTRMSLERKLAHEIGHATTGISDIGNFNVGRTDSIMKKINGTTRKYYSNASSWCLTCE